MPFEIPIRRRWDSATSGSSSTSIVRDNASTRVYIRQQHHRNTPEPEISGTKASDRTGLGGLGDTECLLRQISFFAI